MRLNDFVVIDIETTGLSPQNDEIIELAALRVRDGAIVSSFESLVKPSCFISSGITDLTGITNDMVADAPCIGYVIGDFLEFIGRDYIMGHNVSFDLGFIKHAAIEAGLNMQNNRRIDTYYMARELLPDLRCRTLPYLVACYNIKSEQHHRSITDCKSTYEVYCCLTNKAPLIYIDPAPYMKKKSIYSSVVTPKDTKNERVEFNNQKVSPSERAKQEAEYWSKPRKKKEKDGNPFMIMVIILAVLCFVLMCSM